MLGMDNVRGNTLCYFLCSRIICPVNSELTKVTAFSSFSALFTLSDMLHNTVSAVIAGLYFSRPRVLRLARSVSSRAVFVVVSVFGVSILLVQQVLRGRENCPRLEPSVQFLHLV